MAVERIDPFCEEAPDEEAIPANHVEGCPDDGSSTVTRRRRGRPPGARNKLGRGTKGTARDLLHPLIPGARKRLKAILKDPRTEPELAVKVIALLFDRVYGRPIESSRILADIQADVKASSSGNKIEQPVPAAHRVLSVFNMARHEAADAGLMPPLDEYDASRPADARVVEAALAFVTDDGQFRADPAVMNVHPNNNDTELLAELMGAPKRADGPYNAIMAQRVTDAEFTPESDNTGATIASHEQARTGANGQADRAAPSMSDETKIFEVESDNADTPKYPPCPGHRIVEKFSDRVVMTCDEDSRIHTLYGVREITHGHWGWRFIQSGSPEMLEHLKVRGKEESRRGEYAEPSL